MTATDHALRRTPRARKEGDTRTAEYTLENLTCSVGRRVKRRRAVTGDAPGKTLGDGRRKEEIIRLPCLVGRVVGPLLAARALPLRCAASTVLSSTLLAI